MALPISVPYSFANATTSIPLSQLDTDISTIYATVNGIGNGTVALSNVVITGGIVSNVSGISTSAISNGTSNVSIATANGSVTVATAGNTAMTVDTSQNTTVAGTVAMGSSFKRNRIINGNMVIDQRNAGASVTPGSPSYMTDRWQYFGSQAAKFTAQQNAGAVTTPVGFPNYLGMTVASSVSIGASDYFVISQAIEGFNFADLGFGTASAKSVTLSFLVYSSLTGTFGGALKNYAQTRSYPFSYTISAANTWTTVSITIAGDTAGTWVGASSSGAAYLQFGLGVGSSLSGTAGAWAGTSYSSATGAVSVVGTPGATFYITGVQLEVGTKATPYEMQIYSDQLAQCQRYYTKSYDIGTAPGTQVFNGEFLMQTFANNNLYCAVRYPVTMRTDPTLTFYPGYGAGASPTAGNFWNYGTSANVASAVGRAGSTGYSIEKNTGSASVTIGWQYTASAEL